MKYLSVCSGIEAATMAWHSLGWEPVAFSEIEQFPCAVLAHHYPDVPNWGDMTKFQEWPDADVDVLVGGTPCQSFSVAGLRKGLADPRGNLMLTYLAIAARYRPRWLVWENVPGVLSSNGGKDFGTLLGGLAELGYGFAYRVLDAQYVRVESHAGAVPQRRRRVFVVGYLGDWRRAAAVLFERESLRGHPAPCRKAGEAAPTIPSRSTAGGGLGTDFDCDDGLVAGCMEHQSHGGVSTQAALSVYIQPHCISILENQRGELITSDAAYSLKVGGGKPGQGYPAIAVRTAQTGANGIGVSEEAAHTLDGANGQAVAFKASHYTRGKDGAPSDVAPPLSADADKGDQDTLIGFDDVADPVAANQARTYTREGTGNFRVSNVAIDTMRVRRLTPRECERLQGFPDDFTLIPYRGKPAGKCPDGPRYRALGNSMAVNVMNWIGQRIQIVEELCT